MCKPSTFNGSKEPQKGEASLIQKIKDVHIAVFFDGTNNNAVQKAYYNDSLLNQIRKEKKGKKNPFKDSSTFKKVSELKAEISRLETYRNLLLYDNNMHGVDLSILDDIDADINEKRKQLEEINVHPEFNVEDLAMDVEHFGYSNVALLYSLFDKETYNVPSIKKHFYIEGSGANDIGSEIKMNINGLGFGLGETGVTALVSKAVINVTRFIDSIKSTFDENTKLKFYVFGFSRGSTCARLFTYLLTREKTEILSKREKEFSSFCSDPLFKNGRLNFLEDYKEKKGRVKVEFLGIYDTVASIGFLKQKDGYHDPLRAPYGAKPNYKDNWHYRNVTEYGLFICKDKKKLANVCHIGALDEFRENFAFTNIGREVPKNAIEILIPGCHSDVGGGYIDEKTSQEIILHKTTKKLESLIDGKTGTEESSGTKEIRTYLTFNPQNKSERQEMSLESLEKLGWIESESSTKKRNNVKNHQSTYTLRAVEHDNIMFNHVKFKRSTKRGYSDIPLQMMIKCCSVSCETKIFQSSKPQAYDYTQNPDLKLMGDDILRHISKPTGNRIWIIPNGGYSGESYRKLRLKYLHFTATGRIAHVNLGINIVEGEFGNFGNKPNFDMDGTLCRITYDGDKKNEDFTENSYQTEVKYLYDLEAEDTRYVVCDINLN